MHSGCGLVKNGNRIEKLTMTGDPLTLRCKGGIDRKNDWDLSGSHILQPFSSFLVFTPLFTQFSGQPFIQDDVWQKQPVLWLFSPHLLTLVTNMHFSIVRALCAQVSGIARAPIGTAYPRHACIARHG